MKFKNLLVAAFITGLCVTVSAQQTSQRPHLQLAAQHDQPAASENKTDEQRADELKREEIDLLHQAEAKHQEAKALIQKEKTLRGEEVSQETSEKADKDKKDRGAVNGEVKQEGNERSQFNHQADELEKERAALTKQANEKAAERKVLEAKIQERNKHKK